MSRSTPDSDINFSKVNRMIDEGRYFRAKEMVHGMIGSYGFRPELFSKLGDIFVHLKEPALAGQYYFFSGIRTGETEALVAQYREYLERKIEKDGQYLSAKEMPKAFYRASRETIPENILAELADVGVEREFLERRLAHGRAKENLPLYEPEKTFSERLQQAIIVGIGFAVFFGGVALLGGVAVLLFGFGWKLFN